MPRPRKVPLDADVAAIRAWWRRYCAIPGVKEMAHRYKISRHTLLRIAQSGYVPRGNVADLNELAKKLAPRETQHLYQNSGDAV